MSVLGMATGAIVGLIAITPASGYVGIGGGLAIGAISGVLCYMAVTTFKKATGVDDALDVFALHGVGGLIGTVLTPALALSAIAPVTSSPWINLVGAVTVGAYGFVMTWFILYVT